MTGDITRRNTVAIVGTAIAGVGGCLGTEPGPDGETPAAGGDGDETEDPTETHTGDEVSPTDDGSAEPDDVEAGTTSDPKPEADDEDESKTDLDSEPDLDPTAVERSTIDVGESIGAFDDWYGAGGADVSVDSEEAVTASGCLRVELRDTSFATAGYDFPEPFDVGTRHLSTAVKVDAPAGGDLEFRLRAPSSDRRFVCSRRLPPGMTDWMRVDLGIVRGKQSPVANDVRSLRVHVAGDASTDVRFWLDDVRVTESSGESYAILAFYGGRRSHYETVFPLLQERGIQAAVPVSTVGIGAEGRMDGDELRELRDAGWDVCSFPASAGALPNLSRAEQRSVIEQEQSRLVDLGFERGARHFFAPQHRMNGDTIDIVQDLHETGFLYGGNSAGMPPTAPHTLPVINGGDYDSSRSVILRADRHEQLVVLAFDRIGPEATSVADLEAQLDRLESNGYAGGLNVITPSQLVDDHR